MINRKKYILTDFLFVFGWLFCTYEIHRLFTETIFYHIIHVIFLCGMIGIWGISALIRIPDKRIQKLFVILSVSMLVLNIMKMLRANFFRDVPDIELYAWYLYYIPIMMMPLISFYIALCIMKSEKDSILKKWLWLVFPALALSMAVLTNNLHQFVFIFDEGPSADNHRLGAGYFIILAFIAVLTIATLCIVYSKARMPQVRKRIWLPTIPMIIMILYVIYTNLFGDLKLFGYSVILFPDMLNLILISIWELFIQSGLMPVNSEYDEIFLNSDISALIKDASGNIAVCGETFPKISGEAMLQAKEKPIMADENTKLFHTKIRGGELYYTQNLAKINKLNTELKETVETIRSENNLIDEEIKLKEDNIRYKIMNRVYDDIAAIVHSQTVKVQEILNTSYSDEDLYREKLAEVCFLSAYIKIRGNLVLLEKREGTVDILELYLAVNESFENLSLCGKNCFVYPFRDEKYMSPVIVGAAYDFFENLMEKVFDILNAVMVNISVENECLILSIMLDITGKLPEITAEYGDISITEHSDSITVELSVGKDAVYR